MRRLLPLALLAATLAQADVRQTFETDLQLDLRAYTQSPLLREQEHYTASVALTPEWYREWDGGFQSVTVTPFARLDHADDRRSHNDIRELHWQGVFDAWEIRFGISRVFWGRTELLHLVDTINQDDALENLDGEDKLGQPMLRINYIGERGSTQLYLLPYFRERGFAGPDGRLRPPLPVDDDDALYESGAEQDHLDWALRHSNWLGGLDFGVAWFSGTQRDPKLVPGSVRVIGTGPTIVVDSLRPFYGLMDQLSIDAQYTTGSWLWKLEALWRDEFNRAGAARNPDINARDRYSAATGGVEYSFYGVFDSPSDIGLLVEYLWDERGDDSRSGFANDLFIGSRWAANNAADTALLAGVVVDLDHQGQFYNVEFSRRMSGSSKLSIEARVFHNITPEDALFFPVRRDDYVQLEYNWYF